MRCEALWVLQGHHAVDPILLGEVLKAKTPNARAAAMHVVSDEADYLPNAFQLLAAGVRDENPRVRLEAVRGLSFFPTLASAKAALAVLDSPTDSWIEYTLEHTLVALEPAWTSAFENGSLDDRQRESQEHSSTHTSRDVPRRR